MKRINSKQTGNSMLSPPQTVAAVGLAVVWMVIVIMAWMVGLGTYVTILVMALAGGSASVVFFVFVMNNAKFDQKLTLLRYRLRAHRGVTKIHSFTMSLKQLKKHIPIERIHDDGLIEYTKNRYGAVFRYDPSSVPMSERSTFHAQMEYIANSFAAGVEASFHFYDMIDNTNPLADTILRSINTEGKTLEQKKHLHGLYDEATRNDDPLADTAFLLSIKLGKFRSPEHAMIAYRSTIPGIIKAMREHAIYVMPLIGENEIAIEFRQFAIMEKYQ